MTAPLLEVSGVSVRYGAALALRGVDVTVARGEVVALLGANGAGKTTLLKAVMGLVAVETGTLRLDGQPLGPLSVERRAALGVAYAPEGRRLFPGLTVRENLEVACRGPRRERARRLAEAYELFPQLEDKAETRAWKLSGGQSRMLALARALVARPRLVLVDEPSLGLAAGLVGDVMRRLARVAEHGTAVLLAEQNAALALAYAQRAYVLRAGRMALAGAAADLKEGAALAEAVLGA